MFGLATDPTSHELINEFYTSNRIVSAVCHGPVALAHIKLPTSGYLNGQPVTRFSNSEEDAAGLSGAMLFMLEDELNKASRGKYTKASSDWGEKVGVCRGGRLIAGAESSECGGVLGRLFMMLFLES